MSLFDIILQQLLNGIVLGSFYALVALGYTMVYGVVKLLNFGHGDLYMVGGFAGFIILSFLTPFIGAGWLGVAVSLLFAMIAIGFLLAGPAGDKILPYTTEMGIALLWIAAVITLYTGYDYFRAGLKHVME